MSYSLWSPVSSASSTLCNSPPPVVLGQTCLWICHSWITPWINSWGITHGVPHGVLMGYPIYGVPHGMPHGVLRPYRAPHGVHHGKLHGDTPMGAFTRKSNWELMHGSGLAGIRKVHKCVCVCVICFYCCQGQVCRFAISICWCGASRGKMLVKCGLVKRKIQKMQNSRVS